MKKWASIGLDKKVLETLIQDESDPNWLLNTLGARPAYWVLVEDGDTCVVGEVYVPVKQYPIEDKPFDSWVLHGTGLFWEPPVPYPGTPNDFKTRYDWDESVKGWKEVTNG